MLLGPSGGGKSDVARRLVRDALFRRVITCTTRCPRPGEVDGVDYYFLSREEFNRRIFNSEFAEFDTSRSELYGTLHKDVRGAIDSSELPLLVMNIVGAEAIVRDYPEAIVFFLAVPIEQLIVRLKLREMSEESRAERLAGLRSELRCAMSPCVRYIINNEDGRILEAVETIQMIVERTIGRPLIRT